MLSVSQMRCLLAVYSLSEATGRASSKSVCGLLSISKPSVHNALECLMEKGLIDKKPYGASSLTEEGMRMAGRLDMLRSRIMTIFSEEYGLSVEQSDIAALQLISSLNEESLAKLAQREPVLCG